MPALVLAALLQIADVQKTREISSADDCAIFVALGREKLGWNSRRGTSNFMGAEANGYFVDCAWHDLGVARPFGPQGVAFISRPRYFRSNLFAQSTVTLSTRDSMIRWDCVVYKYGGQWHVSTCDQQQCSSGNDTRICVQAPSPTDAEAKPPLTPSR